MSYTIYYHKENKKSDILCRMQMPIGALLLILAVTNGIYHFTGGFSNLREHLLPWTQPEVKAAFLELSEDLADGKPVWDSVESFCMEILNENTEDT